MPDEEVGPAGRTPVRGPFARIISVLGGIVMLPAFAFAFALAPACMGFADPALSMVNACPAATAALGAPITQGWLGLSYGNAETEDDDGRASWSMPVAGPSGRGTLDIRAMERAGRWQFGALVLTAGGHEIDVIACAAGGTGEVVAITHRALAGTATTIVGEPGVASGAACTVTIDPSEGAPSCHVAVVCADRTLYGEGSSGYGHCAVDAGGALVMRDGNPGSVDGDPMLDLRLAANEVVVSDQGRAGTWVVTITTRP